MLEECKDQCRWDGGKAVLPLGNAIEWTKNFNYELVDEDVLGPNAAIHALTTQGKELGLGEWDILVSKDFKSYLDFILVHEAIENYLRREGWTYPTSHHYAEHVEDEMFSKDPRFAQRFSEYRRL